MDVFYVFVDPLAIALLSPSRAPLLRTTVSNERVSLVSLNETISGILLPPAGGHLLPFNGSNRWSNYHHRWRDRKGRHRAARTFFYSIHYLYFSSNLMDDDDDAECVWRETDRLMPIAKFPRQQKTRAAQGNMQKRIELPYSMNVIWRTNPRMYRLSPTFLCNFLSIRV